MTWYYGIVGRKDKKQKEGRLRILFLASFFPGNAGYYWRVEKWAKVLGDEGHQVEIKHVFDREQFYKLRSRGSVIRFQYMNMWKRLQHILQSRKYNTVIVRRTLLLYNEYGNLFYEKLLLAIHPNAILDFDDDMLIREDPPREMTFYGRLLLENHNKFYDSLRLYSGFITGSNYLKTIVLRENTHLPPTQVITIPTCVDYEAENIKVYDNGPLTRYGWIGGSGNLFYLDRLIEPLNRLHEKENLELIIISGKPYQPENANFRIINFAWSLAKEQEYLKLIDIGLMPLDDNELTRGKCGFKLIQYGGVGIVGIGTGLPVNREIIDDGTTGFLVDNDDDWLAVFEKALAKRSNWPEMGRAAREKIEQGYTFEANKDLFEDFLLKNQVYGK
jgi:glycosyltransferase involved in cell wall biosynthesis